MRCRCAPAYLPEPADALSAPAASESPDPRLRAGGLPGRSGSFRDHQARDVRPAAMNQRTENGRTITICPHCHRDISGRVLIIYYPQPDGSEVSMWHCQECKGEWPREPKEKKREG